MAKVVVNEVTIKASPMTMFHELETLSPTRELKTGETLTHKNRTLHLKADMKTLNKLAKTVPGVDLKTVRPAMMSKKK